MLTGPILVPKKFLGNLSSVMQRCLILHFNGVYNLVRSIQSLRRANRILRQSLQRFAGGGPDQPLVVSIPRELYLLAFKGGGDRDMDTKPVARAETLPNLGGLEVGLNSLLERDPP
ncbi:hypothetical protein BC937DRAFT_89237 [Endogone sp. FLAS-F59071]|nr:hypothetical protein BC937DRAFT_89237 [Endogone sp. FLAS-F59071]|eukprot:RUS22421.1 hypothetical protein BC937DRAFT_89237 [Endogone sp. FLAS-F59071]